MALPAIPIIGILVGLLVVITVAVSAYMIEKKLASFDQMNQLANKLANPQTAVGNLIDVPALVKWVQTSIPNPALESGTKPDRKVSFNEVAKDAVNNPWSIWGIAIVAFTGAVLIKQFRGAGRDLSDGVSAVYNEGKSGVEYASGDPSASRPRGKR